MVLMSMVNVLKFHTPKVADKMPYANSVDPDQIAPEGAIPPSIL